MPFTPLAHDRLFLEERDWEPLVREARAAVETVGEFRLASSWPEYAASQVLALGGYWLHEPLAALAEAGLCYDRELPAAAWRLLSRMASGAPAGGRGAGRRKARGLPLPPGLRAHPGAGRGAPRAIPASAVESLSSGRPDLPPIESAKMRLPADAPAAMAELMRRKARLKPVYAVLEVPREAAGSSPEWLEAWMLRRLLERRPRLAENLLSVRETLFAGQGPRDRFPPWFGRSVFALTAWEPEELAAALQEVALLTAEREPAIAEIRLRLYLPGRFFPQADERLGQYLRAEHAPATVRRAGAELRLELGARALKRRVLLAGVLRAVEGGVAAELTIGPRFRLRRYLDLFPEPEAWRRALAEVLSVG